MQQAAAGARSKAVKGLVGGIAQADPGQRQRWTSDLIPRSEAGARTCTQQSEAASASACTWGQGRLREARKEMRAAGKRPGGRPGIPVARLPPWRAPGPSGDRQEHLNDMLDGSSVRARKRLNRALDELTVRWAVNALPDSCRWLLNTQVLFLTKIREPTCKELDDEEWLNIALDEDDVARA